MPLVMMCGYPCSGKTTFTQKLQKHLEASHKTVVVISDDSVGIDRNSTYHSTQGNEKELRGDLRSQVQTHISKETVVILDSLNYIKGFRYELFCISKSSKTPHCVVHTDRKPEICNKWNEANSHYNPGLIEELVMRFEKPYPGQRWDNPCFVVTEEEVDGVVKLVADHLFSGGAPRPNQSTQSQALSPPDFLHQLDTSTQEVLDVISSQQSLGSTSFKIPGLEDPLSFNRNINIAQLRRLKRQFITYTKAHPPSDMTKLKEGFVLYLQSMV
ncbi:protein KTI12 homolog [Bolinopsis microptera]|uniref:protein KTI12 homolog n=1 Tax=Bolinopsis microptera TaxID=2820187 RepID=UPI0030795278